MSGRLARALNDLLGAEGIRGAFLYGPKGLETLRAPGEVRDVEAVARGLERAMRTLGAEVHRVELRCERGRLLVRPLAGGATLALVVASHVTTASLSFSLAAVAAAAAQEATGSGPSTNGRSTSSGPPAAELASRAPTGELTSRAPTGELMSRAPTGELASRAPAAELASPVSMSEPTAIEVLSVSGREASSLAPSARLPDGDMSCHRLAAALGALARLPRPALDASAVAERLRSTQGGDCPQLRVMPDGSVSAHAHVLARTATGAEWAGARRWAWRFVVSCEPLVAGFGVWAGSELGAAERWLLDREGVGLSGGLAAPRAAIAHWYRSSLCSR